MQTNGESKVRQENRYKLPLDVKAYIKDKEVSSKIINISKSACLLRGGAKGNIIHPNDKCSICFKFPDGYPTNIKHYLPGERIKCTVLYIKWPAKRDSGHFWWVVKFDDKEFGEIVDASSTSYVLAMSLLSRYDSRFC